MKTYRMKTYRLAPALSLLLLPLLTGCHKDTVVGKWSGSTPGPGGAPVAMTYSFAEDGKETVDIQTKGGPVTIALNLAGTYKVDGANLTQTITAMTMGTKTFSLPPSKAQPHIAPFKLDGDTMTLTNSQSGQTLTLTRVKG